MRFWQTTTLKTGFAALIFAFAPAANCDGGLREMDDGTCPAGETCDSGTPDGLVFVAPTIGEGLFDTGEVKEMAIGGTQTIQLDTEDGSGNLVPFALPFVATIDSNASTIASEMGNTIVVRAHTDATGYLRITDPADGALYDLVELASHTIHSVQLTQSLDELRFEGSASMAGPELFAPGGRGIVGLTGDDGADLVDDSLVLTGASVTQQSWDEFTIGKLSAGPHTLSATSAGQAYPLAFEVAAAPDSIRVTLGGPTIYTDGDLVCFGAYLGDRFIHVPWTVTADGADLTDTALEGCKLITAHGASAITVHVQGGTLAVDEAFTGAVATDGHRVTRSRATAETTGTLGERARAGRAL